MNVKIRLSSKRLSSGRCQIRFDVKAEASESSWYGYTLADPDETISEVVGKIRYRFNQAEDRLSLHQKVLYNLNSHHMEQDDLMIFRAT